MALGPCPLHRRAFLHGAAAAVAAGALAPILAACGLVARARPAPKHRTGPQAGINGMTITVGRAPASGVTLNGTLDTTWNPAPLIHLSPSDPGVLQRGLIYESPSFTDQIYLQWDDQYFYALERRTQSPPFADTAGNAQYYLGDSLMFFFDTNRDHAGSTYGAGDYAFFLTPFTGTGVAPRAWEREGTADGPDEHAITDVRMGYTPSGNGYGFAIALPWTQVQASYAWTVQSGARVGFGLGATSKVAQAWGQILYNSKGNDQATWGTLELA